LDHCGCTTFSLGVIGEVDEAGRGLTVIQQFGVFALATLPKDDNLKAVEKSLPQLEGKRP
jgi:hypothetical protein